MSVYIRNDGYDISRKGEEEVAFYDEEEEECMLEYPLFYGSSAHSALLKLI